MCLDESTSAIPAFSDYPSIVEDIPFAGKPDRMGWKPLGIQQLFSEIQNNVCSIKINASLHSINTQHHNIKNIIAVIIMMARKIIGTDIIAVIIIV
jgi:hypothetical protein